MGEMGAPLGRGQQWVSVFAVSHALCCRPCSAGRLLAACHISLTQEAWMNPRGPGHIPGANNTGLRQSKAALIKYALLVPLMGYWSRLWPWPSSCAWRAPMQEDSDLRLEPGKGCYRDPPLGRVGMNYFSITEATCTRFKDQLLRLSRV